MTGCSSQLQGVANAPLARPGLSDHVVQLLFFHSQIEAAGPSLYSANSVSPSVSHRLTITFAARGDECLGTGRREPQALDSRIALNEVSHDRPEPTIVAMSGGNADENAHPELGRQKLQCFPGWVVLAKLQARDCRLFRPQNPGESGLAELVLHPIGDHLVGDRPRQPGPLPILPELGIGAEALGEYLVGADQVFLHRLTAFLYLVDPLLGRSHRTLEATRVMLCFWADRGYDDPLPDSAIEGPPRRAASAWS